MIKSSSVQPLSLFFDRICFLHNQRLRLMCFVCHRFTDQDHRALKRDNLLGRHVEPPDLARTSTAASTVEQGVAMWPVMPVKKNQRYWSVFVKK